MSTKEKSMPLVGIVGKRRDIQAIRKEIKEQNIKIIEITNESIKNIKNITFEEIIFLEDIHFEKENYIYLNEITKKTKFIIINGDIAIKVLNEIEKSEAIDLITMGFNSNSTITISSVTDEKIIVYIQKDIKNSKGEILEAQERELISKDRKKIYNNLAVFIINIFHNV